MTYQVRLTADAEADLEGLISYIAEHDSSASAVYVLDKLEEVIDSLADNPERGVAPKELSGMGFHGYRELFFKPYRVIYQVLKKTVYIMIIVDGRRDMQALLQRRLLRS